MKLELSAQEEKDRELQLNAFRAGASYMFTRFGNWYGQGHMFYKSYFEQCVKEGRQPTPVSMMSEEIEGVSQMYADGWRAGQPPDHQLR